eukprot:Rmarinus@m.15973
MILSVIFAVIAVFLTIAGWFYTRRHKKHLPKGYKPYDPYPKVKHVEDNARDNYKDYKVPNDIDVIIIGSGIGGLMCAGLLARCGKKVVVLEQHYIAGGCTHTFEDHGFEFDTGLHYVGNADKYGAILNAVCGKKKVKWSQLGTKENGYIYDEIYVNENKDAVHFRAGVGNLKAEFVRHFPDQAENIDRYFAVMKRVCDGYDLQLFGKLFPHWLFKILHYFTLQKYSKLAGSTTKEVLEDITPNAHLRAVLMGQCGDYGDPSMASFFAHAGVATHYFKGGFYPVGGTSEIARCIIPVIENAGGRVFVRAKVDKILTWPEKGEGKYAYGVLLQNGDEIRAKQVISAVGWTNTYRHLLREVSEMPAPEKALASFQPGPSHLYLFLGLEGTVEELGLRSANIWHLPCKNRGYDLPGLISEQRQSGLESVLENPLASFMFIASPSAKDPSYGKRFPGKNTLVCLTEAKIDWFKNFEDMESGKRGAQYNALKEKIKEALLKCVDFYYPKVRKHIVYADVATPVTNQFYLNSVAGSSYGLDHHPERYTTTNIGPGTEIDNLFLTGQDVATSGFAGALIAGMLTANAIQGYGAKEVLLENRHLIMDIFNLPEADC